MPMPEEKPVRDEPWPPGRCAKLEGREDREQWCNLSHLPDAERRATWDHIQKNNPDTAALLTDPFVQEMRSLFGAEISVPIETTRIEKNA